MSSSRCRTRAPDGAPVTRSGRLAGLSKKKVGVGLVSILSMTALAIPTSALAATAPDLGTAAPFGVLGAASVTNTDTTIVGGDVGVYPGTSITGFPPGIILGTEHDADAVAGQGEVDALTAYNQAAGEAPTEVLPSNDLTGLTLAPGVYKNASDVMLDTNGTLTLDGQGDPDSVFIFQIGSTLTTGSDSSISYINGASPCNVFWQVGSSATLGTGSNFVGTILANTSISLDDSVTVAGRLLAGEGTSSGAVTLIGDTISPSVCTTPTTGGTGGSTGTGTTGTGTGGTGTGTGTTGTTGGTGTGSTGGSGTSGTTGGTGGTGTPVTTPPVTTGPTGTPVTPTPVGTPVTTPVTTPTPGTPAGSKKATTAKQRKARLAKQRKAKAAKARKAKAAKARKAKAAKARKARIAKRAHHHVAQHPKHHAGFTG